MEKTNAWSFFPEMKHETLGLERQSFFKPSKIRIKI